MPLPSRYKKVDEGVYACDLYVLGKQTARALLGVDLAAGKHMLWFSDDRARVAIRLVLLA